MLKKFIDVSKYKIISKIIYYGATRVIIKFNNVKYIEGTNGFNSYTIQIKMKNKTKNIIRYDRGIRINIDINKWFITIGTSLVCVYNPKGIIVLTSQIN